MPQPATEYERSLSGYADNLAILQVWASWVGTAQMELNMASARREMEAAVTAAGHDLCPTKCVSLPFTTRTQLALFIG